MTKDRAHPTIAMMYAMAMNCRNNELCAMQKLNTVTLLRYHTANDALSILNRCNITIAKDSKIALLTEIAKHVTDGIIESIKSGVLAKVTTDNIDGKIVANEVRIHGGSREFHYCAATYLPER